MMNTGSASIAINRPVAEVFTAIADITRMGEWSPECIAGRWIAPATGPGPGAEFEGDNVAKLGPLTLKKWTTTSRVTVYSPDRTFEFVAADYSTWRYDFEDQAGATKVTESFSYRPYTGVQKFLYETVMKRSTSMVTGMEQTLARIKSSLESR